MSKIISRWVKEPLYYIIQPPAWIYLPLLTLSSLTPICRECWGNDSPLDFLVIQHASSPQWMTGPGGGFWKNDYLPNTEIQVNENIRIEEKIREIVTQIALEEKPLADILSSIEQLQPVVENNSLAAQTLSILFGRVSDEIRRKREVSLIAEDQSDCTARIKRLEVAIRTSLHIHELERLSDYFELTFQGRDSSAELDQVRESMRERREQIAQEDRSVKRLKSEFGIHDGAAKIIASGMKNEWKDLYFMNGTTLVQLPFHPGLKVYRDFDGRWCVDYALKTLGEGGRKRAKEIVRIWPDGSMKRLVRFTKKMRTLDTVKAATIFSEEMALELDMRRHLITEGQKLVNPIVPNEEFEQVILWLWEGESYIGKHGNQKIRFFAPRADGSLLLFQGSRSNEQISQILRYCGDVLMAEVGMHERKLVHGDIKPANVFIVEGRGRIGDFGDSGRVGDTWAINKGTVSYLPPKVRCRRITVNDSSTDVYAFGVTLLFSLGLPIGEELAEINEDCSKVRSYEATVDMIHAIQHQLRSMPPATFRTRELWNLIADIIDPEVRPTSTEAWYRYRACLQSVGLYVG
jgi:hypothetical protein